MNAERPRPVLLLVSAVLAIGIVGGGFALRARAAEGSHREVVQFAEVLSLVLDHYVDPVEGDALLDGAFDGLLAGLDARGAFLDEAEVREWAEAGSMAAGPGVDVLKGFGLVQVIAVEDGSPAHAAGIRLGDQLRAIDGTEIRDLSLDQIRRRLMGEAGSTVKLEVVRSQEGFQPAEHDLERKVPAARPYRLDVRDGVAVLTVLDLARIPVERLAKELSDAASGGTEALLIDLRNHAATDPRDAVPFAGLFSNGELFRLLGKDGAPLETLESSRERLAWSSRLGVLVNGATAGGSEAVARLLQVHGATVLGESTYGLGTEPELYRLPDGSGVLVSSKIWELATGERWNGDGVEPDAEVRAAGSTVDDRLNDQLDKAIERFARGDDPAEAPAEAA